MATYDARGGDTTAREIETAEEWIAAARAAERRGELLEAVDLAQSGLERFPADVPLRYEVVLNLARAGSTEEARRRFRDYELGEEGAEDIASLGARLEKDVALSAAGSTRRRHAAHAAALYADVFARTGGYYPGINAATLTLLAGDRARATALARQVLERIEARRDTSYFRAATAAEAQLLLGDIDAAREALEAAAALNDGDLAAMATTRRQLRLVCREIDADPAVIDSLSPPSVIHFCGHRWHSGSGFISDDEGRLAARVREELAKRRVGFGYGSLAAGADLVYAEALLEREAELHVVLPFARDEFIETSVRPAGDDWVARFERCLAGATSVTFATEDAYLGDDLLFSYASELAMGLALLRSRFLDAESAQIAAWDGGHAIGQAGTAVDVEAWRGRGHLSVVLPLPRRTTHAAHPGPVSSSAGRVIRAVLFGDVRGFSRLTDAQLPAFLDHVMGALAHGLEPHRGQVLYRNTWGDGLVVVLADVASAAACALDVQAAAAEIDLEAAALPRHLALRLAGHVGPVLPTHDPILDAPTFAGVQMSRTARIEPVTPPGSVYVSEPFAAQLALRAAELFSCDYVGHMPAAKDYGRLRMYLLRRPMPETEALP